MSIRRTSFGKQRKEEVREDGFDEIAFMNKVKFKSLVDEHPDKGHRALQSIPKI